jgi:UDP-perosamine 4-acetyltransferase
MSKIVVIGGGGHAKVIISILNRIDEYQVAGYTDLVDKSEILGAPYLGDDAVLEEAIGDFRPCAAVIGFGILGLSDIEKRSAVATKLKALGYSLPAIVAPGAIVSVDVEIGDGTVIFDGAVVNAGSILGRYAIVNTSSSVDHDCALGDSVHIAPGATLGGGVRVGDNSFVGAGATVINGIHIAANCVIGAGAVVIRDCRENGKYLGVPARLVE